MPSMKSILTTAAIVVVTTVVLDTVGLMSPGLDWRRVPGMFLPKPTTGGGAPEPTTDEQAGV